MGRVKAVEWICFLAFFLTLCLALTFMTVPARAAHKEQARVPWYDVILVIAAIAVREGVNAWKGEACCAPVGQLAGAGADHGSSCCAEEARDGSHK